MDGGDSYLHQGLLQAREEAKKSPGHKTVYIVLTSGGLEDYSECSELCKEIKNEVIEGIDPSSFFAIAMGSDVNNSSLSSLVQEANGSLVHEYNGEKICDFFEICENT